MVDPGGLSISPADLFDTQIVINVPFKAFPRAARLTPDNYATFSFFDLTKHTNGPVVQISGAGQFYDGSSAEWIDEDPTRNSVCWHWNVIPYKCSTLYKLQLFGDIYWDFAYASGSYGNAGAPTDAGLWPVPKNGNLNNNNWRYVDMLWPDQSCEMEPGAIYNINTDSEYWYDYQIARGGGGCNPG
jgi:hypothetical protein